MFVKYKKRTHSSARRVEAQGDRRCCEGSWWTNAEVTCQTYASSPSFKKLSYFTVCVIRVRAFARSKSPGLVVSKNLELHFLQSLTHLRVHSAFVFPCLLWTVNLRKSRKKRTEKFWDLCLGMNDRKDYLKAITIICHCNSVGRVVCKIEIPCENLEEKATIPITNMSAQTVSFFFFFLVGHLNSIFGNLIRQRLGNNRGTSLGVKNMGLPTNKLSKLI